MSIPPLDITRQKSVSQRRLKGRTQKLISTSRNLLVDQNNLYVYSLNFYSETNSVNAKGDYRKGSLSQNFFDFAKSTLLAICVIAGFFISSPSLLAASDAEGSIEITENLMMPVFNITYIENSGTPNDGTICAGSSVTINLGLAGGVTPYTATWSDNWVGTSRNISPSTTVVYTVDVVDANGDMVSQALQVNVLPELVVEPQVTEYSGLFYHDGMVCDGDGARLTAAVMAGTGPFTYQWTQISAGPSSTIADDDAGTTDVTLPTPSPAGSIETYSFSVDVTDANGCTVTESIDVQVKPLPVVGAISVPAADLIICPDETITLTGSATDHTDNTDGVSYDVGLNFVWSGSGVFDNATTTSGAGVNPVVQTVEYTNNTPGTHQLTLTVTDEDTGCTHLNTINIEVSTPPAFDFTVSPLPTCTDDHLGGDVDVVITNGDHLASYTYTYFSDDMFTVAIADANLDGNAATGELDSDPGTAGIQGFTSTSFPDDKVYIRITSTDGCITETSVALNIYEPPTVSFGSASIDKCLTCPIVLSPQIGSGTAPYTYAWTSATGFTASSAQVSVTDDALYTVTVTDANGCTADASIEVDNVNGAFNGPNVDINVCAGETTTLTANTNGICGPLSYSWSTNETSASISVPSTTMTYTVTVSEPGGCELITMYDITNITQPLAGADSEITVCSTGDGNPLDNGGVAGDPAGLGENYIANLAAQLTGANAWSATTADWTVISVPVGVDAGLIELDIDDNNIDFYNAVSGQYVFQYIVNDANGACASDAAMLTINVESCFDLALVKTVAQVYADGTCAPLGVSTSMMYDPGDYVQYQIEVFNQSMDLTSLTTGTLNPDLTVQNVEVSDYLPNQMIANGVPGQPAITCGATTAGWSGIMSSSVPGSDLFEFNLPGSIAASASYTFNITAQVKLDAMAAMLMNTSEITDWTSADGVTQVEDEDDLSDSAAANQEEQDDEMEDDSMGGTSEDDPFDDDQMDGAAIAIECMDASFACNNLVHISLGNDCTALITPGSILENEDMGPNCGYDIIISQTENGPAIPSSPIVTSQYIGDTLFVKVQSMGMNGNSCWGRITIEDKLPPKLECLNDITVGCNEALDFYHSDTRHTLALDNDDLPAADVAAGSAGAVGASTTMTIDVDNPCAQFDLLEDIDLNITGNSANLSGWEVQVEAPDGTIYPATSAGWAMLSSTGSVDLVSGLAQTVTSSSGQINTITDLWVTGMWHIRIRAKVGNTTTLDVASASITLGCTSYFVEKPIDGGVCDFNTDIKIINDVYDDDADNCGDDDFSAKRTITYVAIDAYGNESLPCTWMISYERRKLVDIDPNQDGTIDVDWFKWPQHWNGVAGHNPVLNCNGTYDNPAPPPTELTWDTNGNDFPDPEEMGVPEIDGRPIWPASTYDGLCELNVRYEDQRLDIPGCASSFKILRKWTVLDWCTSTVATGNPAIFFQIIKVEDNTPPTVICDALNGIEIPVSDAYSCTATYVIPRPVVLNECSEDWTYTVRHKNVPLEFCDDFTYIDGIPFTSDGVSGNSTTGYTISTLQAGCNWIEYNVTDACGNSTLMTTCDIRVVDNTPPIPICDEHTVVSLNIDNQAKVFAASFDDGSFDSCSDVTLSVKRYNTRECDGSIATFKDYIKFCCNDVGQDVMVALLVTDADGNTNSCMVNVTVQDKFPTQIVCPPNVSVVCTASTHPDNTGWATANDNCGTPELMYIDSPNLGQCGTGTISRVWQAKDASGNVQQQCTQIITVTGTPFGGPLWPASPVNRVGCAFDDTDVSSTGEPNISSAGTCSLIAVTHEDQTFEFAEGACLKILRTWTVIDWCSYDGTTPTGNPANPFPGMYKNVQIIKLNNTIAPVFEAGCHEALINGETGSCEAEVTLTAMVSDDCTMDSELNITYMVDYYNNGSVDRSGNSRIFNRTDVPFGTHSVKWTAEDRCGNRTVCDATFEVKDEKAPTPYCLGGVTTVLMENNGTVAIWASDFNIGSFDNCPDANLTFTIRPKGTTGAPQSNWTFNCDHADQVIEVEVHVTDDYGNSDYCFTFIRIQDNGACGSNATGMISGLISTSDDKMLENVDVMLEDMTSYSQSFDITSEGVYEFPGVNMYEDYEITPSKNDDPLNGVSTLDLVMIQRHILGIQEFDNAYDMVAADINSSKSISASDLVELRRLILGLNSDFLNNTSWRFIDATQEFANVQFPWPLDELISLSDLQQSEMEENFVAIKVGDVSGNVSTNNFAETEIRSNPSPIKLEIMDQAIVSGESVQLSVQSASAETLAGMQFTLEWDAEQMTFVGVASGALEISDANYNVNNAARGLLTFSWNDLNAVSVNESETVFTINFKAIVTDTNLSGINISSKLTSAEAYDNGLEVKDVELNLIDATTYNTSTEVVLYQNKPNPFKNVTYVDIDVPETAAVTFTIYDMVGQVVHQQSGEYAKGLHTIKLDQNDIKESGLLYYELEVNGKRFAKKMIKIE